MPYTSPAAIGWTIVSARGAPVAAKRSPMARRTASGQPRPLDELTVMVAPSGISAAAAAAARTRARGMAHSCLRGGIAPCLRWIRHRHGLRWILHGHATARAHGLAH